MPDLIIEHPDGSMGLAEVVRDVDPRRAQYADAYQKFSREWHHPNLQFDWLVELKPGANLRRLRENVDSLVEYADQHLSAALNQDTVVHLTDSSIRITWENLKSRQDLMTGVNSVGIAKLNPNSREHSKDAFVRVSSTLIEGAHYEVRGHDEFRARYDRIASWCEDVIARNPDVASKLRDYRPRDPKPIVGRHIVLAPTSLGDMTAFLLTDLPVHPEYWFIPSGFPRLPQFVDYLWIIGRGRALVFNGSQWREFFIIAPVFTEE